MNRRTAQIATLLLIAAGGCLHSQVLPLAVRLAQPEITESMRMPKYPWKTDITATIFWVGEQAAQNNPVPNTASSWDARWMHSFGGYDNPDPDKRGGRFHPTGFLPRQNPFYVALPYNDVTAHSTKKEAAAVIPWFKDAFERDGKSVCHNRWIAIHFRGRVCFAQWSDCGPFTTTDAPYVFGSAKPSNNKNAGAGLDISPAVRDYLGFNSGEKCDWRFVDADEVGPGPWQLFGQNNPFSPAHFAKDGDEVFTAEYSVSTFKPVGEEPAKKEKKKTPATPAERGKPPGKPSESRLEELRRAREAWFGRK